MHPGNFNLFVRTDLRKWSVALFFALLIVFQGPGSMAQAIPILKDLPSRSLCEPGSGL